MSEEIHITNIEKVTTRDSGHAMHIEGVVDGRKVSGVTGVGEFQAMEKRGEKALREWIKDSLGAIHEQRQERR